jgi:uncharacterized protein (TIGR03435 family)
VLALALPLTFGLMSTPQMRAQAQTENAAGTPPYTASVRPGELATTTYAGGPNRRVGMMYSPDGFTAMNVTLKALIQEAYGVEANQIEGPADLLGSPVYDVDLKVGKSGGNNTDPAARAKDNQRALQAVLADHFQLKVHPESKEISTYAMVVAEGGSKLQLAKPASSYSDPVQGPKGEPLDKSFRIKLDGSQVGLEARGMSTADMASQLSRQLGTLVVDKTGLTGNYDFTLNWKSDASGAGSFNAPVSHASALSLSTAIQEQLGLKLEPQKGPMEILVIDHVEEP